MKFIIAQDGTAFGVGMVARPSEGRPADDTIIWRLGGITAFGGRVTYAVYHERAEAESAHDAVLCFLSSMENVIDFRGGGQPVVIPLHEIALDDFMRERTGTTVAEEMGGTVVDDSTDIQEDEGDDESE